MRAVLLALSLLVSTGVAVAADLPSADANVIKSAGIPVYDQAVFVIGNQDVGYRFATSQPPEAVRQWYQKKLSDWSLFDQYGSWILYKGKKGAGMSQIMASRQVAVSTNEKMIDWHKLKKDMTTEIVIMVPK